MEPDKAEACVRHLMGPRLFSGWSVRTMAEGDAAYNPIGYHVGTIWPHDSSLIAWGLRRYGYPEEAARFALGILQAAEFFKGRLPEAFAGYPRGLTGCPVEYPTACRPQAWSTGAPLLLLRSLLGLEPIGWRLLVDPALPASIASVERTGIPGPWGHADAFGRGRIPLSMGVPPTGGPAAPSAGRGGSRPGAGGLSASTPPASARPSGGGARPRARPRAPAPGAAAPSGRPPAPG